MNRSTFWMIKYMNGSIFSKARYMNGPKENVMSGEKNETLLHR